MTKIQSLLLLFCDLNQPFQLEKQLIDKVLKNVPEIGYGDAG